MTPPNCRWAILGTAGIARKNWHAIKNTGNGTLVAVASRSAARAQAYIDENQAEVPFSPAPRAVAGYDEILKADDIDAVYIPLPTGVRKDIVIAAAKAGKHVLCEKPCGATAQDVEAMISACAEAGVQFMDGVMFMHSDRLPAIREVLDDGQSIGKIQRITSQFSFRAPEEFLAGDNIRVQPAMEPLGALGDLGWYCIRFSLWALNYEMPTSVTAQMINATPAGVPLSLSAELNFASGTTASFYCSFETEHQQWLNLSGTKGNLTIQDFTLPYYGCESTFTVSQANFLTVGTDFRMERHDRTIAVPEYHSNHPTSQETKLFRNFARLAMSGKPDPHWPEISLKTQRVLNAVLEAAQQKTNIDLG